MNLKQISKWLFSFALAVLTLSVSCNSSDIPQGPPSNDQNLDFIEELQQAIDAGKVVSNVKPIENPSVDGWRISFTDGTYIDIISGEDPQSIVTSVVMDRERGAVVVTLASGDVFDFRLNLTFPSDLARVYITTPNQVEITSKEVWLEGCNIRIIDTKGKENLNVTTSVRGRGNSTWKYPKKPYAIKLDSKAEVLGMPKHKRWVLLANWLDRTLLRNDVALEMARQTMAWAPRGEFVEVYLNGTHLGNYYLCEQIKIDKNRVNVDELKDDSDFTNSSVISGGYLLEFDTYGPNDEINYFYTDYKKFPVTIKEPDEDVITSWTHPGYLYIQGYVNEVEKALSEGASWDSVCEKIDIDSFIDFWFVYELAVNREIKHPKSAYMHKKRDGKLYAGPVWDFDYATFRHISMELTNAEHIWYDYLFKYPEFKTAVKTRWAKHKAMLDEIDGYIVRQSELIRKSKDVNISMWPIEKSVNEDYQMNFDEAIANMRDAYSVRLTTLDAYISTL